MFSNNQLLVFKPITSGNILCDFAQNKTNFLKTPGLYFCAKSRKIFSEKIIVLNMAAENISTGYLKKYRCLLQILTPSLIFLTKMVQKSIKNCVP